MIIGVFGDSFAAGYSSYSWTNILSKNDNLTVKNFGCSSTSLFWSYKELLAHINEVDVVIFVATSIGRLYYPGNDPILMSVGTLYTVEYYLEQKISADKIDILNAAKEYYIHLANPDFNFYVHEQIIKSISELCQIKNKKLLLIPAFESNLKYQDIFSLSLYDVTKEELYTNFKNNQFKNETPLRANHMSQENNIRLANLVIEILLNDRQKVDISDFVFKKETNPELYWEL
jgi:hypothetical protein